MAMLNNKRVIHQGNCRFAPQKSYCSRYGFLNSNNNNNNNYYYYHNHNHHHHNNNTFWNIPNWIFMMDISVHLQLLIYQ